MGGAKVSISAETARVDRTAAATGRGHLHPAVGMGDLLIVYTTPDSSTVSHGDVSFKKSKG
jgi:hypothetical protein